MSDQPFDDSVRRALDDIRADYNPSDWERMDQRLDEEELIGTDEALDATVRDALDIYEDGTGVGPSWAALSATLDWRAWRRKYFISKVAECLLLLLLLFTYFHFSSTVEEHQPTANNTIAVDNRFDATTNEGFQELGMIPNNADPEPVFPEQTDQLEHRNAASGAMDQLEKGTDQTNASPESTDVATTSNAIPRREKAEPTVTPAYSPQNPPGREGNDASNSGNNSVFHHRQKMGSPEFAKLSLLQLDNSLSPLSSEKRTVTTLPIRKAKISHAPKDLARLEPSNSKTGDSDSWVSLYAGSDLNFIHTPYDTYYELDGDKKVAPGHGFGLSLDWVHGAWIIGMGISYARKSYQPREIIELQDHPDPGTKYQAVSLDNIGFELFSLPISLRKYVVQNKSWNIYAGGSLQLHIISKSDYRRIDYPVNEEPENLRQPVFLDAQGGLQLDEKPMPEGMLEGGSFFNNTYFTVDFIGGVEYELNRNWRVYAQPMFLYSLVNTGLGPNQDRIHTFSLRLGVRRALQ